MPAQRFADRGGPDLHGVELDVVLVGVSRFDRRPADGVIADLGWAEKDEDTHSSA